MKCVDCLIWQNKREDLNINSWWDDCAKYDLKVLEEFAILVPYFREQRRHLELLRGEECPEGRCRLAELPVPMPSL